MTDPEHLTALREAVEPVPTTIDDVVRQLTAVEAAARLLDPRGEDDGIACFTRLYLEITKTIRAEYLSGDVFVSGPWILALDVAFARRFLAALRCFGNGDPAPAHCWSVLFAARSVAHVPVWHFAALGVNAHVNFDLAFALLDVWDDPEVEDVPTRLQRADYDRINGIFAEHMDTLREQFDAPFGGDDVDGRLGDEIANEIGDALVRSTRWLAWNAACLMWWGREHLSYDGEGERLLDESAVIAARLLMLLPGERGEQQ